MKNEKNNNKYNKWIWNKQLYENKSNNFSFVTLFLLSSILLKFIFNVLIHDRIKAMTLASHVQWSLDNQGYASTIYLNYYATVLYL